MVRGGDGAPRARMVSRGLTIKALHDGSGLSQSDRLTGVHPDYWLYLTELRGITERVREVVAQARKRS